VLIYWIIIGGLELRNMDAIATAMPAVYYLGLTSAAILIIRGLALKQ
jgi:hypothetical protein